MSPRSQELMVEARERLEAARTLIARAIFGAAVSDAYYAILYAARAALSERDRNARTHAGIWALFHEEFVAGGLFQAELARGAAATQEPREQADYGAARIAQEEAERILDVAERFVEAVAQLIDG